MFLHPQFFAEDGVVWYQQAYNLHWLPSLAMTQAGYLQTLPRLIAGVCLLFPLPWAPLIMNLTGAIIQVLPITALLSRRCASWGPLSVRLAMAVLYLAIADAGEIHVVLTNAMWHLALLQALLVFSPPPATRYGRVADVILFGIGAVSGPFCMMLLLPAVGYWRLRKQPWTAVLSTFLAVGSVLQVVSLAHSARSHGAPLGGITDLVRIMGGNIFVDSMTGSGGPRLPLALLWVSVAGGFAILAWGWQRAPLSVRCFMVFAGLVGAASLRDPLVLGSVPRWRVLAHVEGVRYWFFPSLVFLWSALWCAARGGTRPVRYAGCGVLLLVFAGDLRLWRYRAWPDEHFIDQVHRFNDAQPGEHVTFPIYPNNPQGKWQMELIKR